MKRLAVLLIFLGFFIWYGQSKPDIETDQMNIDQEGKLEPFPLTIEALRKNTYPGSDITIEQTLTSGSNYDRFIASYQSEGNKIFGLLTIPKGENSYPVIIFNHGYIPPKEYRTTERYVAYVDGFARNGYIVFKPDYRGHGSSKGESVGAYGSNAYTIDVLNAVSSIKKMKNADPNRIGMWGHSMGGFITLRVMVTTKDVKAGIIWGGVVGSYEDLLRNWRRSTFTPPPVPSGARRWRQELIEKFGEPEKNPQFWNSISAIFYVSDISGPLELHHGEDDASVPVEFSKTLAKKMQEAGKEVELFTYPGDDHNITSNFSLAMNRSINFFDRFLK